MNLKTEIYYRDRLIYTVVHPRSIKSAKAAVQSTCDRISVRVGTIGVEQKSKPGGTRGEYERA
jgi:hypothetical protein